MTPMLDEHGYCSACGEDPARCTCLEDSLRTEQGELLDAYKQQFGLLQNQNATLRRELYRLGRALCRRRRQRKRLDEKIKAKNLEIKDLGNACIAFPRSLTVDWRRE